MEQEVVIMENSMTQQSKDKQIPVEEHDFAGWGS